MGQREQRRSRPAPSTETARNPRKPTVSSRFRHRDHAETPETGGLVPLQAPRPHGILENRRSRPTSGTETTRKPRKAEVSSRSRHRDSREAPKTDSLVPPRAPRLQGSFENWRSRPTPGTETAGNLRKPEVSSRFRHRDHTEASKTIGLVPFQTPRLHGSPENWRSRPASGTETAGKHRKPKVSSLLRHRDHTEGPKTGGLVPLQAPRPYGDRYGKLCYLCV